MREFTSKDVERYAGIPQAILRDWRRRKILSGKFGAESASGRWTYHLGEGGDTVEEAFARKPHDAKGALALVCDLDELAVELREELIALIRKVARSGPPWSGKATR